MTQGVFIVLEGGEGSGKDTVIEHLKDRFSDRGDIVYTREPGGTRVGERIRTLLMDAAHSSMSVEAELMLFLAARAELMREVVRPALAEGRHVISNRFALSTIAYQIYRTGRHEYRSFLDELSRVVVGDVTPTYILLDVEPRVGLARTRLRAGTPTRFDKEDVAVHERVREGYRSAVREFPHVIVDANRPLPEVQGEVYEHVSSRIIRPSGGSAAW